MVAVEDVWAVRLFSVSLLGTGRLLGIYVVIAGDWCFAIPFTDMQVFHGRLLFTVSDYFFFILHAVLIIF